MDMKHLVPNGVYSIIAVCITAVRFVTALLVLEFDAKD
jgi:hypothetical protein